MSSTRPWIAYVGPVAFPEGGAAARRILGNAQALEMAGYDVTIVSGQSSEMRENYFCVTPGISCVTVNERDAERLPKALRNTRYVMMGSRSRKWLDGQDNPPAAVILYSGYSPYLLQLTGWARRRKIPLLFDAVEWYSAESAAGFVMSPYLWNIEAAMRILIPRLNGVIVISRALEHYYTGRGIAVHRVPPLLDCEQMPVQQHAAQDGTLRLAYSGSPGRKDLLDRVITAVGAVNSGLGRLVLDVAGVSEAEMLLRPALAGQRALPGWLRTHGRVPHAQSVQIMANADFTVFLREINRVSTYGFPTKFVESLALGVPVITNLTSDLADHLRPLETGLICDGPQEADLRTQLYTALALPPEKRIQMRRAARAEAERAFDYRRHAVPLKAFIGMLRQKMRKKERDK